MRYLQAFALWLCRVSGAVPHRLDDAYANQLLNECLCDEPCGALLDALEYDRSSPA